jgi:hypothetical protein
MRNKLTRRGLIRDNFLSTIENGIKPFHPDKLLWIEDPDEIIDVSKIIDTILHTREEVDFWLADKTCHFTNIMDH